MYVISDRMITNGATSINCLSVKNFESGQLHVDINMLSTRQDPSFSFAELITYMTEAHPSTKPKKNGTYGSQNHSGSAEIPYTMIEIGII